MSGLFSHRLLRIGGFCASAALIIAISAGAARAEPSPMNSGASAAWESPAGDASIVRIARRYLGATGPQLGLGRAAWCGRFLNLVRRDARLRVVPSALALDHVRFGRRIARPVVGAFMLYPRKGGGHGGIISAVHADGTVSSIDGNWGRRVAERRSRPKGIFIIPS